MNREEREKILVKYLPLIGEKRISIDELRNQNPFKLSWGQKRRLNLSSIFSYDPDLLLIDEPFIGQDADSIQNILSILHDFHEQGKTIIIVSHDQELLIKNCTRIIDIEKQKSYKKHYKTNCH